MPTVISVELRQFVAKRANYRCEYCLLPLTAVARVTLKILCINGESRVHERSQLQKAGLFD